MHSQTHELRLQAAPEIVFAFLADIGNMPRWSTNFCSGLERKDGLTWLHTPAGPMVFTLDAEPGTRVVDFIGGPSPAQVSRWYGRVLADPNGGSIFLFTAVLQPGQSLEEFRGQCELLHEEFANLKALLDGPCARVAAAA
jgi:hypothetical protein